MKHHYFIFIICSIVLLSCNTSPDKQIAIEVPSVKPSPIDSFIVSGIDIGQQAQDFRYVNDTTLCSYDLINNKLVFFQKDKAGNYNATVKKKIDTDYWSQFFRGDDNQNYFMAAGNKVTVYDPSAESKMAEHYIHHVFKHMGDTFALNRDNNSPVITIKDTLIAVIGPYTAEGYKNYFKEQEIAEFKIDHNKDTITFLRSYITKPKNLVDYEFPFGNFCFHNNTVFLIYPPIDTLYMFNRSTNITTRLYLNNRNYTLPDKFPCNGFTPEYGSCETKYLLDNFRYTAIRYNPLTKHFILFYHTPVSNTIKDRKPTFNDQPLQAVVLDEKFNTVQYLVFKNKFWQSSSFFHIPGKGFAMPIFKGTDAYETMSFYIYNL